MSLDPSDRILQETSVDAYDGLRATLGARQQKVLDALKAFVKRHGRGPTSYELFQAMKRSRDANDLNDVRPRLTELRAQGRVKNADEKRICTVTHKRALVWQPVVDLPLFD